MTSQDIETKRAWFQDKLREVATKNEVAIDDLFWRNDATHESSQLTIASSGKAKTFPINDAGLLALPQDELEDLVQQIVKTLA